MGAESKIEWTDATWTPIRARNLATGKVGWHCEHVSEGCRNCYSESMNKRLGTGLDFKPGHRKDVELFLDETMLTAPLRWQRGRRVFVCSMTDLFADFVPDEWIDRIFAIMALAPQHTFQVLTKRPERMRAYLSASTRHNSIELAAERAWPDRGHPSMGGKHVLPALPFRNVMLGVSIEDQATADARVPLLLDMPAAMRFVSAEPMLGPIDLNRVVARHWASKGPLVVPVCYPGGRPRLDGVICGGESGPGARTFPGYIDAARSLRDQSAAAGVAFHYKQHGAWLPACQAAHLPLDGMDLDTYRYDHDADAYKIGKKAAGRLLDGVTHDGMPHNGDAR